MSECVDWLQDSTIPVAAVRGVASPAERGVAFVVETKSQRFSDGCNLYLGHATHRFMQRGPRCIDVGFA
jgi:hypothetical protein